MHEISFIEHFKKTPVFSLSDVNQLIQNKIYAKKFLKRMIIKKRVFRIKKNLYTAHDDPFLISTFIKKPSYISGISALSYRRSITQIPNMVFCSTLKKSSKEKFGREILFRETKHFFGYSLENYDGFLIPIADIEKAIIDSIGTFPVHIIEEAMSEVNEQKMTEYLNKIKESKTIKRIGYLMEENGFDVYKKLKKCINYKYIYLDPLGIKKGKKNKKWRIINNK
jgi:predicted transcriptional regulator of viral defense system